MKLSRRQLKKLILQEMRRHSMSPAQQELLDLQTEFDAKLATLKGMAADPELSTDDEYSEIVNTVQKNWGEQRYNADALRQANALMDVFLPHPEQWRKENQHNPTSYRW